MSWLERHAGCPTDPAAGCFGPVGPYWTLFGGEVRLLGLRVVTALLAVALLGFVLWRARVRGWPAVVACGAVGAALFLALAWAAPPQVDY